jgi:hypothetical protein
VTYPAGSEPEFALNNQNVPSRLSRFVPPTLGILAALTIFALSLGTYCLHYFPFEDDFSLIRYSTAQNSPAPATWITRGFTEYFANDPQCVTRNFGFDRPVANATFYLESLFYRSAEGPLLLATNFLSWIVSAWFVYGIARRLGAGRWFASAGILLYALSPCWYRGLIHASFRNNGLAACFLLAATYLLLEKNAVRSWLRLVVAGVLIALAAGSHEQGFTSLPVFVVGIAWFSFKAEGRWRTGRIALAILAIAAPSLLMLSGFRLMNPAYGASYVTTGFLSSLNQSRHLAAFGIHNTLLIVIIKLAIRIVGALISALGAFTPLGADNMAQLSPYIGIVVFVLTGVASVAIMKRFPGQVLPVAALVLFAVGRSIGIPSAEPRFMHMEVAWGIIMLTCALSAGFASGNRTALVAGGLAALGLLAFNVVSYNATILMRHSILLRRNEVDREAFHRIRSAATKYPSAQAILANDQAGLWSARSMLELAGFKKENIEILPSIIDSPSTDVLRNVAACPVSTQVLRFVSTLQVHLDYPAGCTIATFGRDISCEVKRYQMAGRPYAATWAAFLQQPENEQLFPPPLIHDLPIQSGRPLVVIAWRDRLSVPDVTALPNENGLALDNEVIR